MKKILIIEDDAMIRQTITEILQSEEFTVITANNGKQGLQRATQELPHLILCDVMMPELNGYEVLEVLRRNQTTATIPLIFLTALADRKDTRRGMELGADDYLIKPCDADELLKAVETRLNKLATVEKQQDEKLQQLRSNISLSLPHELRTYLNSILGFSELLLTQYDFLEPADIRDMVSSIHLAGENLYRITQNFLLYAELELMAYKDKEETQEYRMGDICYSSILVTPVATLRAKQDQRQDDLHLHLEEVGVVMEATRFKKMVEEIIDNAFKFSSPGTPVSVTSRVKNDQFILTIRDRGRGMTSKQIAQIGAYMQFERKVYEQQGTGLGLTIAKRLAELYGGQFHLESTPGAGTTVEVSLEAVQDNFS